MSSLNSTYSNTIPVLLSLPPSLIFPSHLLPYPDYHTRFSFCIFSNFFHQFYLVANHRTTCWFDLFAVVHKIIGKVYWKLRQKLLLYPIVSFYLQWTFLENSNLHSYLISFPVCPVYMSQYVFSSINFASINTQYYVTHST